MWYKVKYLTDWFICMTQKISVINISQYLNNSNQCVIEGLSYSDITGINSLSLAVHAYLFIVVTVRTKCCQATAVLDRARCKGKSVS